MEGPLTYAYTPFTLTMRPFHIKGLPLPLQFQGLTIYSQLGLYCFPLTLYLIKHVEGITVFLALKSVEF